MPGPEEDDDETLIADTGMADESTDEGRTLVVSMPQDDQDETLIARFPMRLSPRGALPEAATLPRIPSRPTPAAGRPMAVVPAAGVPAGATPRTAPAAMDLDRRALPFPGGQPPRATQPQAPPKGDFFPVSHTLPLAGRDLARIAAARGAAPMPAPVAPSRPSAPPPARTTPPPPLEAPRPMASAAPSAVPVAAPLPAPAPPAPRAFAAESAMAAPPTGTPVFVIRFLLVCGVLTALGLMALIYLEL